MLAKYCLPEPGICLKIGTLVLLTSLLVITVSQSGGLRCPLASVLTRKAAAAIVKVADGVGSGLGRLPTTAASSIAFTSSFIRTLVSCRRPSSIVPAVVCTDDL